jgi:hypothetical protein
MLEDEIKKINLKKSCKVKKNTIKKRLDLIGKKQMNDEIAKKYCKNHLKK